MKQKKVDDINKGSWNKGRVRGKVYSKSLIPRAFRSLCPSIDTLNCHLWAQFLPAVQVFPVLKQWWTLKKL